MIYQRVEAPAALVPLADLKHHCRVDGDHSDALLSSYLSASTAMLEGVDGLLGGKLLGAQTWLAKIPAPFASNSIHFYLSPISGINSVTYQAIGGGVVSLDVNNFNISGGEDLTVIEPVQGFSWPPMAKVPYPLEIEFDGGISPTPETLLIALKMLVLYFYENRGDKETNLPQAVSVLLSLHRKGHFG